METIRNSKNSLVVINGKIVKLSRVNPWKERFEVAAGVTAVALGFLSCVGIVLLMSVFL